MKLVTFLMIATTTCSFAQPPSDREEKRNSASISRYPKTCRYDPLSPDHKKKRKEAFTVAAYSTVIGSGVVLTTLQQGFRSGFSFKGKILLFTSLATSVWGLVGLKKQW